MSLWSCAPYPHHSYPSVPVLPMYVPVLLSPCVYMSPCPCVTYPCVPMFPSSHVPTSLSPHVHMSLPPISLCSLSPHLHVPVSLRHISLPCPSLPTSPCLHVPLFHVTVFPCPCPPCFHVPVPVSLSHRPAHTFTTTRPPGGAAAPRGGACWGEGWSFPTAREGAGIRAGPNWGRVWRAMGGA